VELIVRAFECRSSSSGSFESRHGALARIRKRLYQKHLAHTLLETVLASFGSALGFFLGTSVALSR